ncbi:baseplate assembly protein [Yersinia alsatica]|nr:baseplate assembly protein [Yersinia alsatica]
MLKHHIKMSGENEHFGGQCSSNGVVIDTHGNGQVQCGHDRTLGIK